jgi:acetyl-CoA C-acetyltransferase
VNQVWLSGIGMTSFAKHGDVPLHELGRRAAQEALDDAGLDYDQVGEVFGSTMLGPPQSALRVAHSLGHTGAPVTGIESASAGGLVALRHAARAVWSGEVEVALAVGYEKMTALEPGGVVPAVREVWDRVPPQGVYAIAGNRFLHEAGVGPEVFAVAAAKSWNSAARYDLAARRVDHEVTAEEVLAARMVCTPLTRMMCHANADGGAAVVVTRDPLPGSVALLAIEQTSIIDDPLWPRVGPTIGPFSQTAHTAARAYQKAGVEPSDVGVVSLHDLCTSEEVITLVELGLGSPEEVVRLVLDGGLERHGRLPTNLDGGCIARGHPSGATALGQAADIVRQLRGSAGDRQVPGDVHTGVVQTMGGGGSAAVAVLRRQDA